MHAPLGATMHAPQSNHTCPQSNHTCPLPREQPSRPSGSNHTCPPRSNHACPQEQPCMPPRSNHACPPGATMHAPEEQPHIPPQEQPCSPPGSNHACLPTPGSNHACPPGATMHAPQEQPCMPPQEQPHMPPQEQPCTPLGATMHACPPLGATMHAPPTPPCAPWEQPCTPLEQPCMPPRSNHTCPPPPGSNHACPPGATMHAPPPGATMHLHDRLLHISCDQRWETCPCSDTNDENCTNNGRWPINQNGAGLFWNLPNDPYTTTLPFRRQKISSPEIKVWQIGYLFYVKLQHSMMKMCKRISLLNFVAACSRQVNSFYCQLYQLTAILPTCCYLFTYGLRETWVESICLKESFILYGTGCGAVCRHLVLVFSTWQITLRNICYTATQETEHMTAMILKAHWWNHHTSLCGHCAVAFTFVVALFSF